MDRGVGTEVGRQVLIRCLGSPCAQQQQQQTSPLGSRPRMDAHAVALHARCSPGSHFYLVVYRPTAIKGQCSSRRTGRHHRHHAPPWMSVWIGSRPRRYGGSRMATSMLRRSCRCGLGSLQPSTVCGEQC